MSDFSLKKTRIIVIASIIWVAFSFYLADTNGGDLWNYQYFVYPLNFHSVHWNVFVGWVTPVWVYWAYYWIKKGR